MLKGLLILTSDVTHTLFDYHDCHFESTIKIKHGNLWTRNKDIKRKVSLHLLDAHDKLFLEYNDYW